MNLIVGASIVGTMQYYDCPIKFILEIVIKKTVPHIVATVLFALVLSIVLSVKYRKNFSGSQNFFQKFFIGTSMNPTLGPIDVKLSLYRYSFLMTVSSDQLSSHILLYTFHKFMFYRFCSTTLSFWTL